MNFSYLKNQTEFEFLYNACREAEQFALSKPHVSALSARQAMEWIIKYIYAEVEPNPPYGCAVYDMTQDVRFQIYYVQSLGEMLMYGREVTANSYNDSVNTAVERA